MRKLAIAMMCSTVLAGCDTVQLAYKVPSADATTVLADAQVGYNYIELPRTYILVAPAASATPSHGTASGGTGTTTAASGNRSGIVANKAHGQNGTTNANANTGTNPAPGAATSPGAQANSGQANGTGDSGSSNQSPNNALANAVIDGVTWSATAVPMPDSNAALLVKGDVGFWQSTTLGIARYDNSDLPKSISSNAQNLVPKRLGQIATVIGTIAKVATVVAAEGESPLKPFSIKASDSETSGDVPDSAGWSWALAFDGGAPQEALSYGEFTSIVAPASQAHPVPYWPVPACRAATLTLSHAGAAYLFHLTVGTPDYLRPQILPVDGSMDPGTVCSGSTKGTVSADPATDVVDDLTALQNAIGQIKPATSTTAAKSTTSGASGN